MREIRKEMKIKVEKLKGGNLFYIPPDIRKYITLSAISIYDKEKNISLLFRDDKLYSYKPLLLKLKDDDQIKKVKAFINGIEEKFKGVVSNE